MISGWIKWIVGVTVGAGTLIGGYYVYKSATFSPQVQAWSVIPANAIYVIESDRPVDTWKKISKSQLWSHLRTNPFFSEINEGAMFLDSLIENNPKVAKAVGSQHLTISAHPISTRDYDFIYYVDLEKSQLGMFKDLIKPILNDLNEKISVTEHQGTEIIMIKNAEKQTTLHLSTINNLLIASYSLSLIYKAIEEQKNHRLEVHPDLLAMRKVIADKEMFNLYVQFQYFDDFLKMYSPDEDGLYATLPEMMTFAGFKGNVGDDQVHLEGLLHINDSTHSYLKSLINTPIGTRSAHEIASYRTALYLGLLFDDYNAVWQKIQEELKHDPQAYNDLQKQKNKIEKLLNISIENDFLAWMKGEVALLTLLDGSITGREEKVMVFHTRSIQEAQEGLGRIMKQVRKRSPLKFKTVNYKEYEINLLEVKGFFKLILGKMFQKFDKPYFTYIDDYVVMANNIETLQDFIDDYDAKKTLAQDETFLRFESKFGKAGHLFAYVAMKNTFPTLKSHLNTKDWNRIQAHEPYFLACKALGLSLYGKNNTYAVNLRMRYDAQYAEIKNSASPDATLPILSPADSLAKQIHPDGPYEERFRNDKVKVKAYYLNGKLNGDFKSYHKNGKLETNGRFLNGKKSDVWYYYNRKGKLLRKETYNEKCELTDVKVY